MDVVVDVADRGHAARRVISIFYFISLISEISFGGYLRYISVSNSSAQLIACIAWGLSAVSLVFGLFLVCCNSDQKHGRFLFAFSCSTGLLGCDVALLIMAINENSYSASVIILSSIGNGIAIVFHVVFIGFSVATCGTLQPKRPADHQLTVQYSPSNNPSSAACLVLLPQTSSAPRLEPSAPPLTHVVEPASGGFEGIPTQCQLCKDRPVNLIISIDSDLRL